jgi:hypothetical protein
MVVVQEFRQLLPQAFVTLAFVTENDGPFKEGFLERLGQMAPEVERGGAKNKEIAVILVDASGAALIIVARSTAAGWRLPLQDSRRS